MTHTHTHWRYLQERLNYVNDQLFPHASVPMPASYAVLRETAHHSTATHEQCECRYLRALNVLGQPCGPWESFADWQERQVTMELRGV